MTQSVAAHIVRYSGLRGSNGGLKLRTQVKEGRTAKRTTRVAYSAGNIFSSPKRCHAYRERKRMKLCQTRGILKAVALKADLLPRQPPWAQTRLLDPTLDPPTNFFPLVRHCIEPEIRIKKGHHGAKVGVWSYGLQTQTQRLDTVPIVQNISAPPTPHSSAIENYPFANKSGHEKKTLSSGGIAFMLGGGTLVATCVELVIMIRNRSCAQILRGNYVIL
ncbi:hypothetical protein CJ030_MR3G009474 [Morella rubra]|uniref:Uncharacterized protein n=1 Tax=Morella rubra TaxID=262757 RepID=A0A6A1W3P4_9ROSI|nr:hypothetical protein CJ030_MR3G009474 [Morella rubra]